MDTTELVKSVSIENLVNQRMAVLSKLSQGLDLLSEAQAIATAAHIGFPDIGMNCRGGRDFDLRVTGGQNTAPAKLLEAASKVIDAKAWAYLMSESGLRSFMDATARKEWDCKVHELDVPELTAQNITATFSALYDCRGELFDRGVINCFRALSWDHKTNQPFKFGKRVILRHLMGCYGHGAGRWLSVNSDRTHRLDDLDRVFHLLDGKPEPDHRDGWFSRLHSGNKAGEQTGPYFSVKWFLNGNGHLTFMRADLVAQMNQILAKHFPNALASEVR